MALKLGDAALVLGNGNSCGVKPCEEYNKNVMRIAMRGIMILLAVVLIVASAGTVLCEMDCAAGGHAESAAMTPTNAGASHCDGEQMDSASRELGAHHGSSDGNKKHGAHLHSGNVATVTAQIQILPTITLLDFAAIPVNFGAAIFARAGQYSWKTNSSPPINSPSVFSTGVLRI